MADRKIALDLKGLTVRHGAGCNNCENGLEKSFRNRCPRCGSIWAVRGVSLKLAKGESLGIVGESGSGKTTLMRALYLDSPPQEGELTLSEWEGGKADIFSLSPQQRRQVRENLLGMVRQNPHQGLRMHFSSSANIAEKLIAAGERRVGTMKGRSEGLLTRLEIPLSRAAEPPINFSGGMQQRVQIAKAVANNPPILLLDEVTTGLDLSVQARVLDLVKGIQREFQISMIIVSHDLAVIRLLADRCAVMLDGKVVEEGLTDQILEDPQHYYTQELVNSLI